MITNSESQEKYKYILLSNKDDIETYLSDIYTFTPMFIRFLWENPEIVAELLMNTKIADLKSNLAFLFVNNFYENMLSSNFIEEILLYVIGIMIKGEVNILPSKDSFQSFLKDSHCGIILEQLRIKQDVQTYFKNIISKSIEELEVQSSSYEMNFNISNIEKDFDISKKDIENEVNLKKGKRRQSLTESYFRRTKDDDNFQINEQKAKEFNTKYFPTLGLEEYKKIMEDNKGKKSQFSFEYISNQYPKIEKEPLIYANDCFYTDLHSSKYSNEILASYTTDFMKTIKIIDDIIKNLLFTLHLLPYSVKVICKMILILVKSKFPDATFMEQNAFIGQFFFQKLFSPIFERPDINAYINKFILSKETKYNLSLISFVIQRLFSGKFFHHQSTEQDFTPFNWYFLEKFQHIGIFFKMVVNVNLPPILSKFVNNELPEGFSFDYFRDKNEEKIIHRSICFSLQDVSIIIENMKNIKDKVFTGKEETLKLQKTFEKLTGTTSREVFEKLLNNLEYEQIKEVKKKAEPKKGLPIIKYMLITDLLQSPKYERLFKIKREESNFHLPDVSTNPIEDKFKKENVSKIKNFICILLNNNRVLSLGDFLANNIGNTVSILKQMKNNMQISNFVIDGSIPSEWYVDSIIEYIKKIPYDLSKNDCELLFKEIETALNISIKELDFDSLSNIAAHLKYCKGQKEYFKTLKEALVELQINEKAQYIIETETVNAETRLIYDEKNKELKIDKPSKKNIISTVKDFIVLEDEVGKIYASRNIKGFTTIFPNITKYQKDMKEMENELKLSTKLGIYFKFIQDNLTSKTSIISLSNPNEFNDVMTKVYDFIMEKLYDKIYPKEPDPSDLKIHKNCELFSWTEPRHFIKTKTVYVYDSFLPDVIKYFKEIEIQRSPRKKIHYMNLIFQSISNIVKFNGGKDVRVDDMFPILNYSFIKAKPFRMNSNCKYMDMFIGDRRNKEEGNQLAQLIAMSKYVENLTRDQLLEFTEEDHRRCNSVIFKIGYN